MPLCPGCPSRAKDLCSTAVSQQGRVSAVGSCCIFPWFSLESHQIWQFITEVPSFGVTWFSLLIFSPFKDASVFFSLGFVGNCLQTRAKCSWTEESGGFSPFLLHCLVISLHFSQSHNKLGKKMDSNSSKPWGEQYNSLPVVGRRLKAAWGRNGR